jgi:hypothetical protein
MKIFHAPHTSGVWFSPNFNFSLAVGGMGYCMQTQKISL